MKKIFSIMVVLSFVLLMSISVFADDTCEPKVVPPETLYIGKLVMSVNPTVPPLQYVLPDGSVAGMHIELGNEIARRLCLTPEWVNIQFDAMIPGLTGGRFDMINTGIYFTSERAEIMHMIPYELSGVSVAVPNDNPHNVSKVEDLAGLKIAVEASGTAEKTMYKLLDQFKEEGLEEFQLFSFGNSALSYAALDAGQVDAVAGNDARVLLAEMNGEYHQAIVGLFSSPACLAFANENLAESVRQVLNEMVEDGYYDELFEKYNTKKIFDWADWTDDSGKVYGWNGEFEIY